MTMNLATDPWIPVLSGSGERLFVSLERTFADGAQIRDLAVRPHERIALMRLLLCVAHAGLDGPDSHLEWLRCRGRIASAAVEHLRAHRGGFELLGEGPRFGQFRGLVPGCESDLKRDERITKLNIALATGNNPTVFDNAGAAMGARSFRPDQVGLWLLAFQCFTPPGGAGYTGKCPCGDGNMLHTFLQGSTLSETIWLNLLDKESVEDLLGKDSWGQPIWTFPNSWQRKKEWARRATGTYLGRLVPVTKGIWLQHDGRNTTIHCIAIERKGLRFPCLGDGFREPCATTCSDGSKRWLLRGASAMSIWRDLPAIIAKQRSETEGRAGCLALQRFGRDTHADIWVGGLIVVPPAKIENTVESVFHLPTGALSSDFQTYYDGGVAFAQKWERALRTGVGAYQRELGENLGKPKSLRKAATDFWTAIEGAVRDVLIPLCANPPDGLKCNGKYHLDYSHGDSRWGPLVKRAAEDAFAFACPRASGRQAVAFGRGRLAMLRCQPVPKPATKWKGRNR